MLGLIGVKHVPAQSQTAAFTIGRPDSHATLWRHER
jgi:hypothetical protein